MKETITKNLFLNAVICPTLGWRLRGDQRASPTPTLAQQFRMEQGAEIGLKARSLFSEGVLISAGSLANDAAETAELIRPGGPSVLFEATFVVEGYAAKADILTRIGDAWHVIEVKSNINLKQGLIDDLAYTLMVLGRAGLNCSKASLLLISREFRLGNDESDLFIRYDCTEGRT